MNDETSAYLKQVVLGDPAEHREIVLVTYDPEWPQRFHNEATKIRSALPGREPDFDEHRMLRTQRRDVHIHVFSSGSRQIERHLLFRDHLRRSANDRRRYENLKRELASRPWATMQHYADAKTDLIEELLARARAEDSTD